ncbi:hypothetical protein ebA2850 [Aromatoleum aromaticum EbN1]|uniref:Uncharacterized protein n=1 Tax=Aromatoleum aromaticum (strain DSM 19018 / LMG 30748 / EbN1) TaxID=76114 RepID=Q5P4N6_AROAE|nr:hypothetical protein ebA2850 [Aromatoleum aromaticum EbN1]
MAVEGDDGTAAGAQRWGNAEQVDERCRVCTITVEKQQSDIPQYLSRPLNTVFRATEMCETLWRLLWPIQPWLVTLTG